MENQLKCFDVLEYGKVTVTVLRVDVHHWRNIDLATCQGRKQDRVGICFKARSTLSDIFSIVPLFGESLRYVRFFPESVMRSN